MSENTERRYLKWYNKVGYGSGDVAGNVVYAFLSSFVMIYLTDTVGLNPGIVGTLIAVSKLFDGITDIFFGSMIDKTHSKLGKARPWMLYGYIGCAITLVGIFAIPMGMSEFAKYAWFLICYTLLNAVFYTANNIAYSALTALVTKNSTVAVDGDALHILCVDVAGDVAALIDDQALFAGGGGLVGKDGAEQTSTDDQIIILHFSSPFLRCYANAAQFAAGTQNRGHPWQAGWTG